MKYSSTRGGERGLSFRDAVMGGLARDGGLLLPESFPDVSDQLRDWQDLPFNDLAVEVMRPYVDFPDEVLRDLVSRSYRSFRDEAVTPLVKVGDRYVLELFHGPTLAFKDVALQFLGNVFEHFLAESDREMNIVAATSGDTGSAAIQGVRGKSGIRIFVMHPKGRTSPLQERQMTTVLDENVFNLAVEGTFDDCQAMVKALFNDLEFRDRAALGAVNSINWARVLAQVTYYAYAALRLTRDTGATAVQFAVPTGNFGDIFAGYVARGMGFPIERLVLATNENDILTRFFNTGLYTATEVVPTISPSMDIQVASNFERYLYDLTGRDGQAVSELMAAFARTKTMDLSQRLDAIQGGVIQAASGNREQTLATIKACYDQHGYLLDPHTAVGYFVADRYLSDETPMVCLATAHPAKFPHAIQEALGRNEAHHPILAALADLPTRCETLAPDAATLKSYVGEKAGCA